MYASSAIRGFEYQIDAERQQTTKVPPPSTASSAIGVRDPDVHADALKEGDGAKFDDDDEDDGLGDTMSTSTRGG